jgi:FkbM family methyltransferase
MPRIGIRSAIMRFIRKSMLSFVGLILLILTAIVPGRSQEAGDLAAARSLEKTVREKPLQVSELFRLAGITPGATVADIGAGNGWLTILLARAVGPGGRVYAVDIDPSALQDIRKRARAAGLDNVEVVEGAIDDPRLPRESLDAAFLLSAYHEMSAHDAMLRHIRESLKPSGRLVLVEPTSRIVAPDREAQRKSDVLSAQLAEDDLRKAGFHIAELRDPFTVALSGRSLRWLIVAHRAPGVLLSLTRPAGRRPLPADGREVVTPIVTPFVPPSEKTEDIMRADLRMSEDEVQKRVSSGDTTIIDLRSYAEYKIGHIRGAIHVLPGEIEAKSSEIASRQGPVFLYCH